MRRKLVAIKRWTLGRRVVQFTVLALFLSPLLLVKIESNNFFYGSLASSSFFGLILSDPYAALQMTLASRKLNLEFLAGALLIFSIYLFIRGRVFCSWVCPVNTLLEFTDKLRQWINLPNIEVNRHLKIYLAAMFLILSFVVGLPLFELISPIGGLMKSILFTFGVGVWVLLAIVLFELFISKRGWCRSICPLGGFYHAIGRAGQFRVEFDHNACTGCDKCRSVCFADPSILEPGIFRESKFVLSGDCSLCGACVDNCPFQALKISKKDTIHMFKEKEQGESNNSTC